MPTQPKSWRDVINIHPAADLFPMMGADELRALGEDIKKNGMKMPIMLIDADEPVLLDGRNRLDAMELVGLPTVIEDGGEGGGDWILLAAGNRPTGKILIPVKYFNPDDPFAFVISVNIHRRHLTGEQKRELIANVLKAQPEKSNRQVAAMAAVSHPTVAKVREELEAKGDVVKVSTSIDTKGRRQPARKAMSSAAAPVSDAVMADMTDRLNAMLPADMRARAPKAGAYKPPAPKSTGMHLHGEKIDEIASALHRIAGNGLDVKPKQLLAKFDTEGKRNNLLSSARQAHQWLGELLEAAR